MLCSRSLLVIYFTYSSVYMVIPALVTLNHVIFPFEPTVPSSHGTFCRFSHHTPHMCDNNSMTVTHSAFAVGKVELNLAPRHEHRAWLPEQVLSQRMDESTERQR